MDKVRISRDLQPGMLLMIFIAIVMAWLLYKEGIDSKGQVIYISLIAVAGVVAYLFSTIKLLEFDERTLYITDKKGTAEIPLKNVVTIKLTMTRINHSNFWKIKYRDADGAVKSVRILPRDEDFESFKKAVQAKNPGVDIINISHSFDFDQ